MRARVPLDVDLEDRLLYGLTPIRLAYMVLAVLGALAVWSSGWLVAPVRGLLAAMVLLVGATLAWGRWRGRAADGWLTDCVLFVVSTRRLSWVSRAPTRNCRSRGFVTRALAVGPLRLAHRNAEVLWSGGADVAVVRTGQL